MNLIETTWIQKQRKLNLRDPRKLETNRSKKKSSQSLYQNQILTAKELTKECSRMSLTRTSWIIKPRKLIPRGLKSIRKKKSDRKSNQSLYLNQILTVKEQTRESSKMKSTETTWTPIQRKLNSRCPSSTIKKKLNRKSKRALHLSLIQRAKELTKVCK